MLKQQKKFKKSDSFKIPDDVPPARYFQKSQHSEFLYYIYRKTQARKKNDFFLAYYLKKFEICIAQILINTNTKN